MGYIDEDIKDGTFDRIMLESIGLLFERNAEISRIKDYLDIYILYHMEDIHEQWQWVTHEEKLEMMKTHNKVFSDLAKTVFGKVTTGNMYDHDTVGQEYTVLCVMMDIHNCVNMPTRTMLGTITEIAGSAGYENDKLYVLSKFLNTWNGIPQCSETPSHLLLNTDGVEVFVNATGL